MSGAALGPVQAAVYAALTNDSTLMALAIGGVHDHVEENGPFPYITIGDATELPFDCFGEFGSEATVTMHIWSRYLGYKEVDAINNRMIQVLDNDTGLVVDGLTTVLVNKDMTETLREQDGITRHVVTRFRIITDGL